VAVAGKRKRGRRRGEDAGEQCLGVVDDCGKGTGKEEMVEEKVVESGEGLRW